MIIAFGNGGPSSNPGQDIVLIHLEDMHSTILLPAMDK